MTTLDLMELRERFAHHPLIPDTLARQRSAWRQRWGLPPGAVHAEATSWKYHIDANEISGHTDPNDPWLRLRHALCKSADGGKYFLTGSKGAGKSTMAYSLWQDPGITERYYVLGCLIGDYLNLAEMDASQVLGVMIAHIIEAIYDAGPDAGLAVSEAVDALKDLKDLLKKERPQARLEGTNINFFGLMSAQFKESKSIRESYRAYVDGHFDKLMGLFDALVRILEKYRQKEVLLIIDDLDKIGAPDINENVFHVQLSMLLRPRCAVLYTFPLELHHNPRFAHLKAQANYHVLGNVKLFAGPGQGALLDEGRKVLSAFIEQRLDGEPMESYLDTEVMDRVFRYSCGNYRELCRILQHALQTADMLDKPRADRECLQSAVNQLRKDYNPFLQRNRRTLQTVRDNVHDDHPADVEAEVLAPLIQSLAVVEYPNDPGWLDVHPVLQNLMDNEPSTL